MRKGFHKRGSGLLTSALFFLTATISQAQVPELINYQGRLLDGTNLVNSVTTLVFKVYNVDTGGTPGYQETQTVTVVDGLYSVIIGASNGTPGALSGVLTNSEVYLELCIGAQTLTPRERIVSVAFAMAASTLDGLASGDFVLKVGDTMTGTLNVPVDGFVAGTSQLVLNANFAGLGTATPTSQLHVVGGTGTNAVLAVEGRTGVGIGGAGAGVHVKAGDGRTAATFAGPGGHVDVVAGDGGTAFNFGQPGNAGGDLSLLAGEGGDGFFSGSGGRIIMRGGSAGAGTPLGTSGGDVIISGGEGSSSPAGNVYIATSETGTPVGAVGIGTTNLSATLNVGGTVDATKFVGDGSMLSNVTFMGLSLQQGITNLHGLQIHSFTVDYPQVFATIPAVTITPSQPGADPYLVSVSPTGFSAVAETVNLSIDTNQLFETFLSGKYTTLLLVSGRPAISYYSEENGNLYFRRAYETNGTIYGPSVLVDGLTNDVGQYASMALVNGRPAIAYYNVEQTNIYYVRANDAAGASWGEPVSVAAPGDQYLELSLAIINGKPAIALANGSSNILQYVQANDADGTTWGGLSLVDAAAILAHPSLIEVHGHPAISYHFSTSQDLRYARSTDASGSAWGAPVTVDSVGTAGRYNSMMLVNTNPAISYYGASGLSGGLKFVRATDTNGTAWGAPVIAETNAQNGLSTSLALVNGKPAIAYRHASFGHIRYVLSSNVNGTAWGTPRVVSVGVGSQDTYTSLKVIHGHPAVSFYSSTFSLLKYARASEAGGTNSWGGASTANGRHGSHCSWTIVSGHPAVCFLDSEQQILIYMRASDPAGGSWTNEPVVVDEVNQVGGYASITVVNGSPAISYYDTGSNDLMFVRASDTNGTSWGVPVRVDSAGSVGAFTSLAVVNGNPAISYHHAGGQDLRYVRATDVNGSTWGAPLGIETSNVNGAYTSLDIVNGKPAISYIDDTQTSVRYIQSLDADGATWNASVALDVDAAGIEFTSLEVINGTPAVCYRDIADDELRYTHSKDADGVLWNGPVTVDDDSGVGSYCSMTTLNNRPAIAYYDPPNLRLKYSRGIDVDGTMWREPVAVSTNMSRIGQYAFMLPLGDSLGICAYRNQSDQQSPFFFNFDEGSVTINWIAIGQ